ncbi:citrate synthase protein [Rutstroemia sp. NJR-2017a BBW]|nr:citrate synthase protein [Rutstroemia sp. NJR-2017a BBW]
MTLFFSLWKQLFSSLQLSLPKALPSASEKNAEGSLRVVDSRTGKAYTIPIVRNSIAATDLRQISTLGFGAGLLERYENGLKVMDLGFENTAVCESRITYIDGNRGTIQYRKYTLDYLVENHDFIEVAYLLIWGHLPSKSERNEFENALFEQSTPPQVVIDVISKFPPDTPYFLVLVAGLSAWAATSPDDIPIRGAGNIYQGKLEAVDRAIIRNLAALSTVIALTYCHQQGRKFTPRKREISFVGNQLLMMGIVDPKTGEPEAKIEKFLGKLWILYADHEMTNSTAAFLHVSSTLADPFSGSMASLLAGSGPLHGGAIDLAYKSFQKLGSKEAVPQLIADVKAKKLRLSGYGHRIYKTVDPRVKHLKNMMNNMPEKIEKDPLLGIAMEIDRIASQDKYFTSRNLKANADLFGCFVFSALGFEPEIISAVAGMARCAGVLAHWRETMEQNPKIWRPQQVFTGDVL